MIEKILVLFRSQQQVQQTIDTLVAAEIDKKNIKIVSRLTNNTGDETKEPLIAFHPAQSAAVQRPVATIPANLQQEFDLNADQERVLHRQMQEGGTILSVTFMPELEWLVRRIVLANGGHVIKTHPHAQQAPAGVQAE